MSDLAPTIRASTSADAAAIGRLADRPALVAEHDGVAIAAVALTSGAIVADPVRATDRDLALLRASRYRLLRQGGDVAPLRSLVRRLHPQPTLAA